MNILFISIAWPATGQRNLYTDLMDEFVSNGHHVVVVCTNESKEIRATELIREKRIEVLRVPSGKIRKTSYLRKIFSLFTLGPKMNAAINKCIGGMHFDLILGATPPITLSSLYRKVKRNYNAPFYLMLKDIWPQGSVDFGVIRKYGLPWLYLRSHEKRLYSLADYIGCMSPKGVEYLLKYNSFLDKTRVEVCPNSMRPSKHSDFPDSSGIRKKYQIPQDACVFLFSGNLGIGHGLHFLVDVIQSLSVYKKAFFIIGGGGTQFKLIKEKLNESHCTNNLLYEWLPREDFNGIMNASDVGLILLYKYTVPQFPSRLLNYLDYSKPVLCAVNEHTDIGKIIERSGCGKMITHGNTEEFISAVKYYCDNMEERIRMGERGHELLINNYTVSNSYEIIMKHFDRSIS